MSPVRIALIYMQISLFYAVAVLSKVIELQISSSGPLILSQFCFPTVPSIQGRGNIALEAQGLLPDQRLVILEGASLTEAETVLEKGCEVDF